jgi:hypothetical protein
MIGKRRGEAKGSSGCGGGVAIKGKAPFYRRGGREERGLDVAVGAGISCHRFRLERGTVSG